MDEKHGVVLRKGAPGDCDAAKDLISHAIHSDSMQQYLFGLGSLPRSKQYLKEFFQARDTRFSHNYATVAIVEGKLAGLYIGYPGEKAVLASLKLGRLMLKVLGLWNTVRFAYRARPLIFSVRPARKEQFYIEALSVLEEHRGLGLGRKLLDEAEREGASLGMSYCVLDVGLDNEHARGFYEHMGYEPQAVYLTKGMERLCGFKGLLRLSKKISLT